MWPFTKIARLKKEVARLEELVAKQLVDGINLEDLNTNNGDLSLTLSGSPMHIFADAFYQQFSKSGATNFLTVTFTHSESGERFEVTMTKIGGESTSEQLVRLRQELTSSADVIDQLVKDGYISHHPQVELDALTHGMRSIAQK